MLDGNTKYLPKELWLFPLPSLLYLLVRAMLDKE
jgi:hypothetical protein